MTADTVKVDPSNLEALRAWDGPDGDYWSENEHFFDHSLHRYQPRFLDAAGVGPDDRVLDVGCGNGQTTRDAARRATAGEALGIDLSHRMIEQARRRAAEAGLANARFVQGDAQIHPFEAGSFDRALSRTGTMFFGDPVAAFANIARALRPGGKLVQLVWQPLPRNHWIRDFSAALAAGRELPVPPLDAPGPFSLSEPGRVRSILSDAGFTDVAVDGVEELMWFGDTADEAFRLVCGLGFSQFMLRDLDDASRRRALDDLRTTIERHDTDEGVLYPSAAWLVGARLP